MMKIKSDSYQQRAAFSLAEVVATLIIGAMILVAVLGVYNQAGRSAAAVTHKLDSSRLPREVLQRIAEDLDRIISSDPDTKIVINNKYDAGLPTARIVIRKTIKDSEGKEVIFEEITWQTNFDYESDTSGLVLYRSHRGIALEDKLLEDYPRKEKWERELFVPICSDVTFFRIQVPSGEEFQNEWTSASLPPGIVVTLSFAEPYEVLDGTLDVPEEEKITRTIAIDRTRKIAFNFKSKKD